MRYTENFKKEMVRLLIAKGMTYKKLSELTEISQITLRKWHDEYYYTVMQEMAKESRNRRNKKYKREVIWHQYGSGAGRYE